MLACAVAIFLTPVLLHAYDNESQLRARQALEEKMKELDAQQPTTSAPPAMVAQPQPAPTKTKKQKPAKVSKSAKPAAHATQAQQPAPAVQKPAAPVASQPAPAASQSAPIYSAPPTTGSSENEENLKLQEALREKMIQNQQPKSAAPTAPSPTTQPWNQPYTSSQQEHHVAHAPRPSRQPAPSLPAMTAPPTGLSASKQQKLDELLQLYRADQITPQEYHERRAKILSEP